MHMDPECLSGLLLLVLKFKGIICMHDPRIVIPINIG